MLKIVDMKRKPSRLNKEEYMFSLISEQEASGRSVKSFCSQHNIPSGNWFYWQKKYQQRQNTPQKSESSFTLLQLTPTPIGNDEGSLFAEYKGIRLYRPVSASFLKELMG
jgi:hypothetical protein